MGVREQRGGKGFGSTRDGPSISERLELPATVSLTFPPEPPNRPLEVSERERSKLREALEKGEFPEAVIESLNLVDPKSERGARFHDLALTILKRHIPADFWDLNKQPIRILLSTSTEPNAFYVKDSNPPAIGITTGMFRPCTVTTYTQERFEHLTRGLGDLGIKPGAEAIPIQSVSDLAAIVMHELTHASERERRGAHANDKIEEILAYTRPLEAMHRGKLDPRAMYRAMIILLRPESSVSDTIGRLVDPHPQRENTLNAIRLALTRLSYERGRITPLSTPDTEVDKREMQEISRLASLPGPTQRIERLLSAGYSRASPPEQARELAALIKCLDEYDWDRADEIAIRVEAFAKRPMAPVEEIRSTIIARVEELHPSLSARLYGATQTGERPEIPNQLRPLHKAMREVVSACALPLFSQPAIEEACARLLSTVDTTPLLGGYRGRVFTCHQILEHFPAATRGAVVPWEPLRRASANSPVVNEAAIKMGFARDPVIGDHLRLHRGLGEKVIDPEALENPSFPYREVSWGPAVKVRNMETFLHHGKFVSDRESGTFVLQSIDSDESHPYHFSIHDTESRRRFEESQGRAISLALSILERRPLNEASNSEERLWALRHLTLVSESCQPRFAERPAIFREVDTKLLFLTPTTLRLAPSQASDIVYAYLQSATDLSITRDRQEVVVLLLEQAVKETAGTEVIRALSLQDHHIIPTNFDAKNLSRLPLAVALLSDTLNLSPRDRLSLLSDEMCALIRSPADESMVFETLRANGILTSINPERAEILAAIQAPETPWLGQYTLTRYALREVLRDKDIPQLLLTLVREEPEKCAAESFIKDRVTAYEKQMRESVEQDISAETIKDACSRFAALNQSNLIPILERPLLVQKLLSHVDSCAEPERQLALRLAIAGGLLEEDYIIEARIMREVPALIRKAFGPDDQSEHYQRRALACVAPLSTISSGKRRSDLGEIITREMIAQRPLAQALSSTLTRENIEDEKRPIYAAGLDSLLYALQSGYGVQQRRALLRFLSCPWDQRAGAALAKDLFPPRQLNFLDDQSERSKIQKPISNGTRTGWLENYEVLIGAHLSKVVYERLTPRERAIVDEGWRSFLALSQAWHRQFADSSLPVKSGIIHQILFPDGLSLEEEPHIRRYVAETIAPTHADHAQVIQRLTHQYLHNTPFVKREPLLSAIIVAAWKMGPRATVGRTMVEVACALGPAEVKMVQRMRGHNAVPENIRRDSATSVYRVGEPTRLELLEWVDQVRDHLVESYKGYLASIGQPQHTLTLANVGEIKGAGSMGVTVKVTFSNGESRVLYLVRPFARERGEAGFGTFQRMAEGLPDTDQSKEVILDLIESAKRRITLEASAPTAKTQYDIGVAMYRNKKANANGEQFAFNSPRALVAEEFLDHGRLHGYFLMEEVPGMPMVQFLADTSVSIERKRAVCAAVVAREIHNYLHFLIEPDRNEGNIFIDGSTIHHLDLKAMRPTPWSAAAKEEIAPFLVNGLVDALKRNQNLAELLSDLGGDRSELSEEGFELLTEIETGLMSLAPYINHLKTEDLQAIALGVLDAGMDPLLAKAAARPLPPLFAGIGERYLKGERGFLIPKLPTILKTMGLEAYVSLIGRINLPD